MLLSPTLSFLVADDWSGLETLDVSSNSLGEQGVKLLFQKQWWGLWHLDLSRNSLDEAATEHLVNAQCPHLQTLILSFNVPDHDAREYLAESHWPLLQRLDLSRNRLGLEAVQYLMEGDWPLLETLDLYDNLIAPYWNYDMGQGLTGDVCQQAIVLLTEDSSVRLVEGINYLGPMDKLGNGLWPRLKWLNLDNQNTQSCRYYTHNLGAPMYERENDT